MFVSGSTLLLALAFAPEAATTDAPGQAATPWIRRHRPRRNMFHLGVFGGVLLPARDIELFELDTSRPEQGFRPFASVAPEFGGRLSVFPLDFLGLEVEGAFGLGDVEGERANLWSARGHVIGQIPRWSVTPFVLAGAGALGVRSEQGVVGNDTDLAFHIGGGVAVHVTRWLTLRLDVRDVITPQQGTNGGATNNPEVLLGVGWTRRPREEPAPRPVEAPPLPPPVLETDSDGDGFIDDQDACPEQPGISPDGCPDPDPDGDGYEGDADACPDEAGGAPDGCPTRDADGDGIVDAEDACPEEAESFNGYQDLDGCPDELPEDLGSFEGTLEGVKFQIDSASLRASSKSQLDEVVAVLLKYAKVSVEISGHTDSTGAPEHNVELSKARAETVKDYLVQHGVAADRVKTRGAGPDEPIDTNTTPAGRANNRRIEFRLLD